MRRVMIGATAGLLTLGGALGMPMIAGASTHQTAANSIDLSMTGSVVSEEDSVSPDHFVVFTWRAHNGSKYGDDGTVIGVSVTNGEITDTSCFDAGTHNGDGERDGSVCEPPGVPAGASLFATDVVQPTAPANGVSDVLKMQRCVYNGSSTDPKKSNNCATLSVTIKAAD